MSNSEVMNESFDAYHERSLPELLAGEWGEMAARGARSLPPLAIRVPEQAASVSATIANKVIRISGSRY